MNGRIGTLTRGEYQNLTLVRVYEDYQGKLTLEQCAIMLDQMRKEEIWICSEYQVAVDKTPTHGMKDFTIWHLSIKRRDKEPIHDWRDLQEIKNQLCGKEIEALEIYPAEERKVDSANQYHLWAFMRDSKRKRAPRFPVGWTARYVQDDPFINGKQRPVKDDEATNPEGIRK